MKYLLAILVLATSTASFATSPELMHMCNVSGLGDGMSATGTGNVTKSGEVLTLSISGTATEEGETRELSLQDQVVNSATYSGNTLTEEIKKNEVAEMLAQRLQGMDGGEPSVLTSYQGKLAADEGAGLTLISLKGTTGKVSGLMIIGWSAVFCD